MAHDQDDDKILEEAKDLFEQCVEAEKENRIEALADLKFGRMGDQWDDADREAREQDGRPMLTINRLPSFIRQIVNEARQNKPSIKVHPVDDSADPDTAEILNGIIRNIEIQSKADVAYDTAIDSAVSNGFGYFRIDVDYDFGDTFDQSIKINRVGNPFTVYRDPNSTSADTSDWNHAFVTEMVPEDEFKRQYPDAEPVDFESDERDEKTRLWYEDKSVRVAEYWVREEVQANLVKLSDGQSMMESDYIENQEYFESVAIQVVDSRPIPTHEVTQYLISGAEVLETNPWAGKFIPIIDVIGDEVNIEGKRYFHSLIHFAKDSQRIYNHWRTAETELIALSPKTPFIGKEGAFDNDDRWATANTTSHPYLEYSGEHMPQRQPFAGPPAGAITAALAASDDMKSVMGMYDASLGARSNETSGVAIRARQAEGDVSNFHFLDNMSRAIRHAGVVILDLIPHVYHEPRVMRIMGEDETPEVVRVNQEFPVMGRGGQPQMQPPQMDPMGQPLTQEPVMQIYDLTAGKYDVTVKAGPSFTSRREEAAQQMTQLLQSFPQAAPVIGDILAESLDWPRADEIAKRLKSMLPPGIGADDDEEGNPEAEALKQQMQQGMQAFQQLQQEHEGMKVDKSIEQQKLQIDQMKAQGEQVKIQIEQFKAETDRMAAEAEAMKDQAEAAHKTAELQMSMMAPAEAPTAPVAPPEASEPVVVNVNGSQAKVVKVHRDEMGVMQGAEVFEQ